MQKFVILCPSAFDYLSNKTGNMLIRYRPQEVCCVIDPKKAGQTAQDILGFGGNIPVVSNFKKAMTFTPKALVIGSSPQGGYINGEYRRELKAAIHYGCNIYSGMHQFLNDDHELATLAEKKSVTITDYRRPPNPPHFPKGSWKKRKVKVLLIVGTDCNTGKMTTGWEITERLKKRGKDVRFVGTGQTGIMLAGSGVPVDAVVSDFMAGEIEFAIDEIGDSTATQQSSTWGTLIASVGDIIEYSTSQSKWLKVFDASNPDSTQHYVTNLNTGIQYRFNGTEWVKSYEGIYIAGKWSIIIDGGGNTKALKINVDTIGQRTQLSVRPERVSVNSSNGSEENKFQGIVEELIYLGDHIRVRLEVSKNKDFIVKIPNEGNVAFKERDTVNLSWQANDIRALDLE